jgi:hypothetical protein
MVYSLDTEGVVKQSTKKRPSYVRYRIKFRHKGSEQGA